ncbi:toluene-4-monooxygenase system B family protein [Paraburkholderia sp. BR10937]|uniref:toluene-4-monooxygenase system B family protein n=1 Tax=Paraburkholderia sp. BR10937 TaxID=3236994 RepID=UPI0034D28DB1
MDTTRTTTASNDAQPITLAINALFIGDIVTQLVFVRDTDTIAEVAEKVAAHSVGIRVPRRDAPMVVYFNGVALPMSETVTGAGIDALQCLTVRYAE